VTDLSSHPLRLLVVDDHEVVRQGLVALLDRREGFQVVAEAWGRPEQSFWGDTAEDAYAAAVLLLVRAALGTV